MKYLLLITFISCNCFAQSGKVYDTYKTRSLSDDESHGTIFPKPFQEYNYVKTHRGIEVYETYKTRSFNTNESSGTIFSKPFPKYIIINDKVCETYKTKNLSTNESSSTIFTKPFESKQIFNKTNTARTSLNTKITYEIKYKQALPSYNGEGDISYGK
jgi:ATP sulfurylase